jgi:hypothetical protein
MNALNTNGGGTLTLVAPSKVHFSTGNTFPIVATLTLNYVPEPGTASLLAVGALSLAVVGRKRR